MHPVPFTSIFVMERAMLEFDLETEIGEQRERLRLESRCRFVDRMSFCELLISHKRLQRDDNWDANVRGLLDSGTGIRYLIEAEKLLG